MSWNSYLAIIIMLVSTSGSIIYIRDTLRGVTKPNRVTHLLWSIPIVAGIASLSHEFSWANVVVFVAGVMSFLTFLSSFVNKNAYWKLKKTDYICGILAIISILFWTLLKDPVLTITFSLLADIFATIPTLIKCYNHPETETGISYLLYAVTQTLNLLNVKNWVFSLYAFPIWLVLCNCMLTFFVYRKKIFKEEVV